MTVLLLLVATSPISPKKLPSLRTAIVTSSVEITSTDPFYRKYISSAISPVLMILSPSMTIMGCNFLMIAMIKSGEAKLNRLDF